MNPRTPSPPSSSAVCCDGAVTAKGPLSCETLHTAIGFHYIPCGQLETRRRNNNNPPAIIFSSIMGCRQGSRPIGCCASATPPGDSPRVGTFISRKKNLFSFCQAARRGRRARAEELCAHLTHPRRLSAAVMMTFLRQTYIWNTSIQ